MNYIEVPVDVVSSFRHRQLTLYDCQKIRTKEDNSSDVIDLITLSNIDGTGTADRITKDDTCSDMCMLAAYTV